MGFLLQLLNRNRVKEQSLAFLVCLAVITLSACTSPQITQGVIQVNLIADGRTSHLSIPAGTTAQAAVTKVGLTMGSLDRLDPPGYTVLSDGAVIKVIRVSEDYEVSDVTIPFEHQIVKNESLPAGQQLLIQPGVNGTQEITTRIVTEDGTETSREIFKTVIVKEAIPEILMVGVQAPFASLPIPGRLVYLIAGNAWLMQTTTGNRLPIVTTGDLDGQVFSLSSDGSWLLFSRKPSPSITETINSLWVVKISNPVSKPIDLKVKNVIRFADWVPGQNLTISYSTVEPRVAAPGWQANNDLQFISFDASGAIKNHKEIIGTNSGGIYGWWGTSFAWSPDGSNLAYARPDEVGLVNLITGSFSPLIKITPLQTHSDWAWVPPLNWSPDSSIVFTVTHAAGSGQISLEESKAFDLTAIIIKYGSILPMVVQSGMFANPVASPSFGSGGYRVGFLQAIFPDQSDSSRYKLVVMDRDGANRQIVFPSDGLPGLDPQQMIWAPLAPADSGGLMAVIYQGNIWLIDVITGDSHQITGDGLASRLDWK
jgi:resuscitation-promoting factor RpfB